MSREFGTRSLRLNLVDWFNETFNPREAPTAQTTAAAAGSFLLRNGAYPTIPTEIYQKLSGGVGIDKTWVKQNLVNLRVFNVKNYGAVGNGVTNDVAAIQAAITACVAAGGGTVYFPRGDYALYRVIGVTGIFILSNQSNIRFQGDGFGSHLLMTGDFATVGQFMFQIVDRSHGIGFYNLQFDGSGIINPDPGNQHHYVNVEGLNTDVGPPHDVDIVGNWFSPIVGACVRVIGETGSQPYDVRVLHNFCGSTNGRSFVEAQRYSKRVQVHFNWSKGPKNTNLVDMEPSGGAGVGTAGPEAWSILGNQGDHQSQTTEFCSLAGASATDPSLRNLFAYNTVTNGGAVDGVFMTNTVVRGNIITVNSTGVVSPFSFSGAIFGLLLRGNICICTNVTNNRNAITLIGDVTNQPSRCMIASNICQNLISGGVGNIYAIQVESGNRIIIQGNLVHLNTDSAGSAIAVRTRSTNAASSDLVVNDNLIIATNQSFLAGIGFNASPNNITNEQANGNLIRQGTDGVLFARSAAELFLGWRDVALNNIIATSRVVVWPPTNVGASIGGNAGPGEQFAALELSAGPEGNVTAPAGSMVCSQSGGAATVLFVKETGAGNTGYVTVGAKPMQFGAKAGSTATAARFFAPGFDLATEGTVEIQFAMPRPGAIRNVRVHCTAGTGGGTNTYTIRKNGANAINVTIANTATNANSAASVAYAAGDLISVQVTKGAVPTTPQTNIVVSFEIAS